MGAVSLSDTGAGTGTEAAFSEGGGVDRGDVAADSEAGVASTPGDAGCTGSSSGSRATWAAMRGIRAAAVVVLPCAPVVASSTRAVAAIAWVFPVAVPVVVGVGVSADRGEGGGEKEGCAAASRAGDP